MKITLTGSLGNISKPLAEKLIKSGHQVKIISSNAGKEAAIKELGAIPAIGSVSDVAFLTKAFEAADVVYAMVPPNFGTSDMRKYIRETGENYAEAIKAAGVTKVVTLSSIGAHIDGGTGPISGIHDVEKTLNELNGVVVKYLRAGFFYINFFSNIDMIKHLGFIGSNYGESSTLKLVHPDDIADAALKAIENPFTQNEISYVISSEHTAAEAAKALGTAIGKPDLKWVEFTDDQAFEGMVQAGLPEVPARSYVEMGSAVRSGILWEDYLKSKPATFGKTKLDDFAKEFAAKYNG